MEQLLTGIPSAPRGSGLCCRGTVSEVPGSASATLAAAS